MKNAGKPVKKNTSVKNPVGLIKGQDTSSATDATVKPDAREKQKATTTIATPKVEKRQPKSRKKPAVTKKIPARATGNNTKKVPDLNESVYPLHPNRIWPD